MMKKVVIVCAAIVLYSVQPAVAQNDSKAKSILEAVSKKINSLKSLKANFTLHLQGAGGKVKDTKKGTFAMKGAKYHVVLGGQEIICDNKTVWTYTKETNEVQVSNFNPGEQTISPSKLFTNFYDKEYKYNYAGEKTFDGKKVDVIDLTPISGNKQFKQVELMVDRANNTIAGGNITEKNGNKYQYEISNFTPNAPLPDTYFAFNAKEHPGAEVVDLR